MSRVVFVTGAGNGIGRACAIAFGAATATVVCTDLDADAAAETAELVKAAGGGAAPRRLDVTDTAVLRAMVAEQHGRLDVMVNVAGAVTARGPVQTLDEAEFDRGVALNLKSLVFGCQAAAAAMRPGGSIINVGSGTVDAAVPDLAAYSIPKAGVLQLTRSLARELGPAGIRVNAVSPGYILTGMTDVHFRDGEGNADPERQADVIAQQSAGIPLGRPGTAAEVASVVRFLAGAGASYLTGQVIRVNGGSVMPL